MGQTTGICDNAASNPTLPTTARCAKRGVCTSPSRQERLAQDIRARANLRARTESVSGVTAVD